MLRISVIQSNGFPPATPITHDFDECGGTIGRDDSNVLALPDPGRHISRMQAQVTYDGMRYALTDHGGNPTHLNGRPLGKGVSATLRDGDEIGIAEYTLRVELIREVSRIGSETQPNPFPQSDPLGLFAADRPAAAAPSPAPPPLGPFMASTRDDDPFAVFIPPAAANPSPGLAPTAQPPLPDDPFAAFVPPAHVQPAARPPAASTDPLGIGTLSQPAEASSLDALFGLDKSGAAHDPFAGSPLGDPAFGATPPTSGSDDPLALLGNAARPTAPATARDDSPMLRDAFTPPRLVDDQRPPTPTAAPPRAPASPPSAPLGGVVSWATPDPAPVRPAQVTDSDEPSLREALTQIVPPTPAKASRTRPAIVEAPSGRIDLTVDPSPPGPAPQTADAGADALLAAFARGIGLPMLKPTAGMTPEFMEHIGRMLRESVQGTVELLIARAATKREVRADVTMIVSKHNNPLKFSPDVNFALMQLLTPQGSGFMGPEEAMRDAYDDLRAHQIGFIAGMRAALSSVLTRFTPAELENRLSTKSLLDSVLPANRKAKLWDLYEQRYSEISREAEDDFHSLFGREFLKAYEAQIDQLQRDRN